MSGGPEPSASREPSAQSGKRIGAVVAVGLLLLGAVLWSRATKDGGGTTTTTSGPESSAGERRGEPSGSDAGGYRGPLAAGHLGGDVVVALLDEASAAIRVQRIDPKDQVVADRVVLDRVALAPDADVKLASSPEGVAVTWRGLRGGKLVRQMVTLGPSLETKDSPADVAAASCATRDAVWFSDGAHAFARPWTGAPTKVAIPKDKEVSLLCAAHRAYAVIEEEERTAILPLAEGRTPVTMVREHDFAEDDQRELAEYTVGDEVGVVRLAASGALALRETVDGGAPQTLHKLKTSIGKDDDVVAVDASPREVVIVYTEDVADDAGSSGGSTLGCTKVSALRIDRQSLEETKLVLAPGRCGHEVGPFFTSAIGDDLAIAWPERTGGEGKPRAPIVALSHARVPASGAVAVGRIEQAADAIVDAGCHETHCFAVALVSGRPKVLRY